MDMKFIKKNKFTFFIILFFLILLVLLLQAKSLFFPNSGKANYGDRLDGLVEVSKDTLEQVNSTLKENEKVVNASSSTSGRIINVIITVQDSVSLTDAKAIGESIKDSFDESALSNYDIQVFVAKESTAENDFPIIGYKAKKNDSFSWTKDREKITQEDSAS